MHEQIGIGVDLVLKKSAYRRTLDNITTVIIAFDGLARIFEQNNDPLSLSELPRIDSQILSSSNNKSFSEGRSIIGKHDTFSAAPVSGKVNRNRLSEDNKFRKVSTLTEKNLKPIKRLHHSIKDQKLGEYSKTPVKSISDKIDTISTKSGSHNYVNLSETIKEQKPPMPHLKGDVSRNHSIYSPGDDTKSKLVSWLEFLYFCVYSMPRVIIRNRSHPYHQVLEQMDKKIIGLYLILRELGMRRTS